MATHGTTIAMPEGLGTVRIGAGTLPETVEGLAGDWVIGDVLEAMEVVYAPVPGTSFRPRSEEGGVSALWLIVLRHLAGDDVRHSLVLRDSCTLELAGEGDSLCFTATFPLEGSEQRRTALLSRRETRAWTATLVGETMLMLSRHWNTSVLPPMPDAYFGLLESLLYIRTGPSGA